MSLVLDVLTHVGTFTVLVVLFCAVLLNESEKRHRREAQRDIGERARIRAASHEAVAKHDLYFVRPADRRVERRWGK